MIELHIDLGNRTVYQVYESLWASNLIACNIIRNNPDTVKKIHITDTVTGELYQTYINAIK